MWVGGGVGVAGASRLCQAGAFGEREEGRVVGEVSFEHVLAGTRALAQRTATYTVVPEGEAGGLGLRVLCSGGAVAGNRETTQWLGGAVCSDVPQERTFLFACSGAQRPSLSFGAGGLA